MHVGRFLRVVVVAAFAGVVGEGQASAQLSGLTLTNNSSANEFSGSSANPSYERRSALAVQSSSATSFATRYSATVDAASALGGGNKTETLATDYTLAFDVTAPGAYTLTVVTSRSGDLNVGTDILSNSGTADTTAVTGTATGGTLAGGTLNLPDPGIASCGGPCTTSISQTASATITGTSNGVPVHHTLRFTFTSSATSTTGFLLGGQEAAVRLGIPTQDTSNGAGQYPGSPARTAASDGHFVTVTLSACGDGIVEPGEQCDLGTAQNGAPGSCCTSTCTLAPSGTVCRPAAGVCDQAETCDGTQPTCPPDVFLGSTGGSFVCRPAAGPCDVAEVCDGTGPDCPPDQFAGPLTVCRPAVGPCDVAELCTGTSASCPADAFAPPTTVCRPAAGPCDVAEVCDGASPTCPADAKSTGVCRAAGGPCDAAETCDGIHDDCPADAVLPGNSVPRRPRRVRRTGGLRRHEQDLPPRYLPGYRRGWRRGRLRQLSGGRQHLADRQRRGRPRGCLRSLQQHRARVREPAEAEAHEARHAAGRRRAQLPGYPHQRADHSGDRRGRQGGPHRDRSGGLGARRYPRCDHPGRRLRSGNGRGLEDQCQSLELQVQQPHGRPGHHEGRLQAEHAFAGRGEVRRHRQARQLPGCAGRPAAQGHLRPRRADRHDRPVRRGQVPRSARPDGHVRLQPAPEHAHVQLPVAPRPPALSARRRRAARRAWRAAGRRAAPPGRPATRRAGGPAPG